MKLAPSLPPRVVGLAAAITLTAGVICSFTVESDPGPLRWDARVLPLVDVVQRERGLRFKHAVPVTFLADQDFEKQLASSADQSEDDKKQLAEFVGQLRALDLVQGDVDLRAAYDDLTGSSIVGLYQPDEQQVLVRGTDLTPFVRTTLVHELTHVLQDQYFDLAKLQDAAPGGDTTALDALVEGDATRVEEAYRATLSTADQATYDKELTAGLAGVEGRTSNVPAVLSDFLSFPYVFGPVLLDALTGKGGNTEVDRAFRHPPTSEAQVLDPLGYPYNRDPVDVADPTLPAGAVAFGDPGPFGQVFLFEVLGSRLGYATALSAVRGWRGDASRGYRQGTTVCTAADITMADGAAAARLASASRAWAAAVQGPTVTVAGTTVFLRSCDPGTAGKPPTTKHPTAFEVLVARQQVVHELAGHGANLRVSACVADAMVADGRATGYRDLTARELSPSALAHLQQVAAAAGQRCR